MIALALGVHEVQGGGGGTNVASKSLIYTGNACRNSQFHIILQSLCCATAKNTGKVLACLGQEGGYLHGMAKSSACWVMQGICVFCASS